MPLLLLSCFLELSYHSIVSQKFTNQLVTCIICVTGAFIIRRPWPEAKKTSAVTGHLRCLDFKNPKATWLSCVTLEVEVGYLEVRFKTIALGEHLELIH